jgi:hypothetical protein
MALPPGKEIGAVSHGDVRYSFGRRKPPFEPAVHWVFAEDIDASYLELKSLGANIVDPLTSGWGGPLKSAAAQPQAVLRQVQLGLL